MCESIGTVLFSTKEDVHVYQGNDITPASSSIGFGDWCVNLYFLPTVVPSSILSHSTFAASSGLYLLEWHVFLGVMS